MIVKAIMVPHPPIALHEVGRGEEAGMQATLDGFKEASRQIAQAHPDTVIVLSPHALMYRDWFNVSGGKEAYGDMGSFQAGEVAFEKEYDEEFTHALTERLYGTGFPGGTEYDREKNLDHGTMVPLYFLDKQYTDYRLVRIGLSGLPLAMHYELGMYIAETAEKLGSRAAVIGSGDLAHCQKEDGPYGYRPEGPAYDERIMETMGSGSFGELFSYAPDFLEKAMECGHRSFAIMAGILDGLAVQPQVLSHEAPFGVGYGIVTYDVLGKDENRHFLAQYEQKEKERVRRIRENGDEYVKLAYRAVEHCVRTGKPLDLPEGLPEELMKSRAGAFVSIHKQGELRGCIGTIAPVQKTLAEEIIENGASACSRDPRFEPVEKDELDWLEISVDVLGEPEVIHDASQLDVKKYGVICTCRGRKGLLLPDLDGVDTVEQQISIACSKGRIDPDDEDLVLERFEVVRHA